MFIQYDPIFKGYKKEKVAVIVNLFKYIYPVTSVYIQALKAKVIYKNDSVGKLDVTTFAFHLEIEQKARRVSWIPLS